MILLLLATLFSPVVCETDYSGTVICHWTDAAGDRHKTTETCYGDRCVIRQVY